MKKAKEYAEQYRLAKDKQVELTEIFIEFVVEIEELSKARNIQTDEALSSIIKELSQKWRSFARKADDGISEDGFIDLLKNKIPMTAALGV